MSERTDRDALQRMLEVLTATDMPNRAVGVLTAGEIHTDLPTIHDVSHREGARLKCWTPVEHKGFGLFMAKTEQGNEFCFDGGGAMHRAATFSWTRLDRGSRNPGVPHLEELGFQMVLARQAVRELLAKLDAAGVDNLSDLPKEE